MGELSTVGSVSGSGNSVNLKSLCDSKESLSINFGPENSTCVADVCCYGPNLDDSVVSDCSDTHLRTSDTRPPVARRAMYSVSEITSKRSFVCQRVLCRFASLCQF